MKIRAARKTSRSFHLPSPSILETLEPRVLLSASLQDRSDDLSKYLLSQYMVAGTHHPVAVGIINGMEPFFTPWATNLHATITWDDGTVSAASFRHGYFTDGAIVIMAEGAPLTAGQHVAHVHYYQVGPDGTTIIDSLDFDRSVDVKANTYYGVNINATAGHQFSGDLGVFDNMKYFGDPAGHESGDGYNFAIYGMPVHIAVTIDWGDGTTSSGALVLTNMGDPYQSYFYKIVGEHTYASAGSYRIDAVYTLQFPGGAPYIDDFLDSTAFVAAAPAGESLAAPAVAVSADAVPAANAADGAALSLVAVDDSPAALAAPASNVAPGFKYSAEAAADQVTAPVSGTPETSVNLTTADKADDDALNLLSAS